MRLRLAFLPVFFLSLSLCSAAEQDDPAISDRDYMEKLNQVLETFMESKDAAPVKELREQLSRKSTAVKLPEASGDPQNPAQLYDARRNAVLGIAGVYNCGKCHKWHLGGTAGAVILTPDGIIATNYHVVDSDKNEILGVITHDLQVLPVLEVLAADKAADVAILRVKGENLPYIPLGAKAQTGEAVSVISHPNGAMFFLSQGYVARYFQDPRTKRPWMSITADFAKGSSGGAVIDTTGNLCGLVANTNTITYGNPEGNNGAGGGPVQMVVKNCVPVESIKALIEAP